MDGKLRNMTSIYIASANKMLLLFRQGSRVVNDVWVGSAGGHFEEFELNDARACVLREMEEELGLKEHDVKNLSLRYVTLRRTKGE
ncbi:MAG: NUDIX domain-containing protein, partial [Lachnospiraceae bacterium]|nr:NUDIX domain-containing protein [Lachnospiraceae bacterium]